MLAVLANTGTLNFAEAIAPKELWNGVRQSQVFLYAPQPPGGKDCELVYTNFRAS